MARARLAGAGEWADRMLPLPPCLLGESPETDQETLQALETTGYFLETKLAPALDHKPLPEARARLIAEVRRLL